MRSRSEFGSTFSKTLIILGIVSIIAVYAIYWCQRMINEIYAEEIINDVWERAKQEKARIDSRSDLDNEETVTQNYKMEGRGYTFSVVEGSTSTLIKVDTGKKPISPGICRILKDKFMESQWWSVFNKVSVIDRMGDEKTDVLIYDCPHEKIPSLRFYVRFKAVEQGDVAPTEEEKEEEKVVPLPTSVSLPAPSPVPTPKVSVPSPVKKTTHNCPSGTSASGKGGAATAGCRCNNSGEVWNGSTCQRKACPSGSSPNASGDRTNVAGCHCNADTPVWSGDRCVKKCSGNLLVKKGTSGFCVECNENIDCPARAKCVNNKCVKNGDNYNDCRWGICQTCDEKEVHRNILDNQPCEVGGLHGMCNGNGSCYPTEGTPCSSVRECPAGYFCNYGGNYNSSKKQRGKFGQTPNVCQLVKPQEFTYKKVTYYYNSREDLMAWCRAANNKANCLWGYLSKVGAESWCASLRKRLLTKAEMADVWSVLKNELPQTYTGYSYWVQEGAWFEDKNGGRSFSKGHPDGYGGKGGVVCR